MTGEIANLGNLHPFIPPKPPMPLRPPARLFFLHILKTGGTSFYRFLENGYGRDESIRDDQMRELKGLKEDPDAFVAKLSTYRLITKLHLDFSYVKRLRGIDSQLQVVTLLRQPISRCFSMIEHWRRVPDVHIAELDDVRRELVLDARTMPVEAFVEKHAQRLSDHQTKILAGEGDAVADPPRAALLEQATANLLAIDFVGLTERLTDTAACVASGVGLFHSINGQKLNETRDAARLTPEERAAVSGMLTQLNHCDVALYRMGHLQFLRMLHRWKYRLFQQQTAAPPGPLAVGQQHRVSMDDPLVGDGWHEREGPPHQSCRWAGPERLSSLFFDCTAVGTLEITIAIVSVISPEVLEGLTLVINGMPVAHNITNEGQRLVVRGRISCEAPATAEPLHLELRFPTTRSAFEVAGIDDHRAKTIAVETVTVRRVG
jgi:hypothetical protein